MSNPEIFFWALTDKDRQRRVQINKKWAAPISQADDVEPGGFKYN